MADGGRLVTAHRMQINFISGSCHQFGRLYYIMLMMISGQVGHCVWCLCHTTATQRTKRPIEVAVLQATVHVIIRIGIRFRFHISIRQLWLQIVRMHVAAVVCVIIIIGCGHTAVARCGHIAMQHSWIMGKFIFRWN